MRRGDTGRRLLIGIVVGWLLLVLVGAELLVAPSAFAYDDGQRRYDAQNAVVLSAAGTHLARSYACDDRSSPAHARKAAPQAALAAKAGAPAKRTTGTTVLGHHPGYVQLSEKLGARRFDVPQHVWARMSDADRWAANQRFLDRTIARGDDIVLATPLDRVRPGSFFERELRYLISQGYRPDAGGTRLLTPGG